MSKNELYNLPPHEDKFLTEQEVRAIISSSQENFTAPATVKTGHWKSNNFISSSTGWKIKANGDCEFNSGTFRGKLIAGSIHIPNETTANSFHTETDGDSYWGCNVADWATDNDNASAYILKTGVAKFQDIFIGSSTKQLHYDGTNFILLSPKYAEIFTTGEDITKGNVVCIKPSYTDYIASDDAHANEHLPDETSGSAEFVNIDTEGAGSAYQGFFKWDLTTVPTPVNILKAEIRLTVRAFTGASRNVEIYRVNSADWAEGTLTWNNKPVYVNDIGSVYGMEVSKLTGANPQNITMVWDVTQLVRQWKAGDVNNYGITLQDPSGSNFDFWSSENTTSNDYKPVLRIYSTQTSDSKVYKADCSDYHLSRCIIGIATETETSENDIKIQTQGQVIDSTFSQTGGRAYLNNIPGSIVTSTSNLNRMIKLGKITNANKLNLNIQDEDILIEKLYQGLLKTGDNRRFYAPADARYALIYVKEDTVNYPNQIIRINRDNDGLDSIYPRLDSSNGWQVVWTTDYIDINAINVNSRIENIYFYT